MCFTSIRLRLLVLSPFAAFDRAQQVTVATQGSGGTRALMFEQHHIVESSFALVLFGAVQRLSQSHPTASNGGGTTRITAADLYTQNEPFPPMDVMANAFAENIFEANGGRAAWDVFIHCWTTDAAVRSQLVSAYKPVATTFEDNRPYEDLFGSLVFNVTPGTNEWNQASMGLSIGRGIMSVLQYVKSQRSGRHYERVVLVRPDVLLIRPLRLREMPLDPNGSTVYFHWFFRGDFHWTLPGTDDVHAMRTFGALPFVSKVHGTGFEKHEWVSSTVRHEGGFKLRLDPTIVGRDEEVYRKVRESPMACNGHAYFARRFNLSADAWSELGKLPVMHWDGTLACGKVAGKHEGLRKPSLLARKRRCVNFSGECKPGMI